MKICQKQYQMQSSSVAVKVCFCITWHHLWHKCKPKLGTQAHETAWTQIQNTFMRSSFFGLFGPWRQLHKQQRTKHPTNALLLTRGQKGHSCKWNQARSHWDTHTSPWSALRWAAWTGDVPQISALCSWWRRTPSGPFDTNSCSMQHMISINGETNTSASSIKCASNAAQNTCPSKRQGQGSELIRLWSAPASMQAEAGSLAPEFPESPASIYDAQNFENHLIAKKQTQSILSKLLYQNIVISSSLFFLSNFRT